MDHRGLSRKAAGSSDCGRRQHRTSSTASRPEQSYESPQGSPSIENRPHAATRQGSPYSQDGYPPAPTRRLSEQPQTPSRQLSEQAAARRYSEVSRTDSSSSTTDLSLKQKGSGSSNEGWDLLKQDEGVHTPSTPTIAKQYLQRTQSAALASSPTPSYDFPGTWPAAIHDTTTAVKQVGSATALYASAISKSGIGKAGWSVGAALASTMNKRALSLADWAADRTGTGADNLPRPIAGWLKGGRQAKEDRRRAERKRKEKEARKARGESSPVVSDDEFGSRLFEDQEGSFTLGTSETNSAGEFVSAPRAVQTRGDEYGFAPAATRGGNVDVEGHLRCSREDYDEDEEEEEEGDGMMRLFQYDDEE
jgi:hypothetical protein